MQVLAEVLESPLAQARDMSEVMVPTTVHRLNAFMTEIGSQPLPAAEPEAIRFYLLNHAFMVLKNRVHPEEPLADLSEVAELYLNECSVPVARAFYYLLLITTRESRHVKASMCDIDQHMKTTYPTEILSFYKAIRGTGSGQAAAHFRQNPPKVKLGQYTQSLVDIFYKGKYDSGYGGPAWGKVADCLNEFVWGRTSAEIMMDTVWTLSHNNGPIFNKGMLYSGYDSKDLRTILDVQRSGQIPQLVRDARNGQEYVGGVSEYHKTLHERIEKLLPEDFGGFTDWYLVEELGAIGTYPSHKNTQKAKFGLSPKHAKLMEEKAKAEKIKAEAAKSQAEKEQQDWFFIAPDVKVKKVTRQELKVLA